jgi:acyl carrier protein
VSTWPVHRAPDAFRHLGEARHIGKVVLELPDGDEPWDPDRAVLITGGLGWLGRLVARHLVTRHGVRELVLVGRNAPGDEAAHDIAELRGLGARVRIEACDVADRAALAAALAELAGDGVRVGGVVHAAGVLDDGVLTSLTAGKLDRTLRPKVDAALNLHELTDSLDLSAFVAFSSLAGTAGSAGQGGYAAGNAFLDGLMEHRRSVGRPGVSLAWGLWAGTGGLGTGLTGTDIARMARAGVAPLSAQRGLDLLDAAFRRDRAVVVAAHWHDGGRAGTNVVPGPLDGLVSAAATEAAAASEGWADDPLLDMVLQEVAAVLGHTARSAVAPDGAFDQIGFDSLTAVELRNRLASATGIRLPVTFIYDWPTPAALVEYLRDQVPETDAAATLLAEITRIETVVADHPLSNAQRDTVGDRLRELLAKLGSTGESASS